MIYNCMCLYFIGTDILDFRIAVFIFWLKSVKQCLPEIRKIAGAPFLEDGSNLRDRLTQIIWDNAESPVSLVCVCLYCHYQSNSSRSTIPDFTMLVILFILHLVYR